MCICVQDRAAGDYKYIPMYVCVYIYIYIFTYIYIYTHTNVTMRNMGSYNGISVVVQ